MADANERTEEFREGAYFLTIAFGSVLSASLPKLGLVPEPEAILVGWTIAFLVGYFIPPRPRIGFVRWMLERLIFLTCFYVAVFKVPLVLKRSLTTPFAYGIPIVIFVAGFVAWFRHVRKSSLRRA